MSMSTHVIKFDISLLDMIKIVALAKRATKLATKGGLEYLTLDAEMDITACHCNGMPLDLDKLLAADDFTFAHDIFGIHRYLNRITGKLEECFVPRCSQKEGDL